MTAPFSDIWLTCPNPPPIRQSTMKQAIFCLLLLVTSLQAEVKLPAIFSDGMVLQQSQLVRIWGTAEVGEDVKVTFGDQSHSSLADPTGKWSIILNPMNANAQPADLVVAGKNTITLKNVLVGEVWICSGQSNMAFELSSVDGARQELALLAHAQHHF